MLDDVNYALTRILLRWSLWFVVLQRIPRYFFSSNKLARFIVNNHLITLPFDVHFWLVVVLSPMFFLQFKKRTMPPPPPKPQILKDVGPAYAKLYIAKVDWEDPKTSCRDYVLCLAEQWVSAVKGMAWFGLFRLACFVSRFVRAPSFIRVVPYFPSTTVAFFQILTRLGAMVSLYQFPELLFQLQRKQQPRPVKGDVDFLQKIVKSLFRWGMPLGIASDLSQILMRLSTRSLGVFCGLTIIAMSLVEIMYNKSRKPSQALPKPQRLIQWVEKGGMIASGIATFVATSVCFGYTLNFCVSHGKVTLRIPWLHLATNGILLGALMRYVPNSSCLRAT